jgi:Zn-dependent membrane protease YugP
MMGYFIFVGPALILSAVAGMMVKSRFRKYSKVACETGLSGAQAAQRMLSSQGISDVRIERVQGFLSDHYDPRAKSLRLSPPVYDSTSLAAIGVACHEAGHAIQHATAYRPLGLRSRLVPVTTLGSKLGIPIVIAGGFLLQLGSAFGQTVMLAGVILFAMTVLFALVTLPVEYDASARARRIMVEVGIVSDREEDDAGKVLNAAFLTYVASAVTAVLTLLYYLNRSGLLRRR